MASTSSFHQWESDPLFAAAEVVQDSVDRMESIFRLLLHEQSLVQGDNPDPKLIMSIEHHTRDLATTLGTAKWQLEDFEREVTLSPLSVKSHKKQNVIARHEHFITAIREHIVNMEKSLEDLSAGDLVRNMEWVNLNEQDRDGLALFLSGGKPVEHVTLTHQNAEDRNILRRFLDPIASSSLSDEIVEQNADGLVPSTREFDIKQNTLRNVDSYYSAQMGSEAGPSIQESTFDRHDKHGIWDLEANEIKDESFSHKTKSRENHRSMNFFGSLGNKLYAYGTTSRNFIKRQKDGEEERQSSSYINVFHAAQRHLTQLRLAAGYSSFRRLCLELFARFRHFFSWLGGCRAKYRRSSYYIQVGQRSDD